MLEYLDGFVKLFNIQIARCVKKATFAISHTLRCFHAQIVAGKWAVKTECEIYLALGWKNS